ncbi:sushi, von Willebrand factor type A, EGF and pentraxin domain-containing protein 1-like, partial [Actinia tenebrosa]|uniref:Sushi, von Willebrand factor type A, EGF and pentraxin domain-containing protein 1-like n=1 Tax=Actinia tenebrosa TaxID=6105 RepID=A0A6P8JAC1_ACTTE
MLNLLHRGICVILLFLMQQTLRNTVEGWKTKGCENPGEIKRGYRVGTNFSSGATVEYFCDPGFRLVSGSRLRTCENGKWSGTSPRCRDLNECLQYDDPSYRARSNDVQTPEGYMCHPLATCLNSIGSFKCKCNAGYHGDGRECFPNYLYGMREFVMKRRNKLSAYACGTIVSRNTSRVRRIVGGKISKHGAWPWQAAIYYENG